jgi:hypothetical protein
LFLLQGKSIFGERSEGNGKDGEKYISRPYERLIVKLKQLAVLIILL